MKIRNVILFPIIATFIFIIGDMAEGGKIFEWFGKEGGTIGFVIYISMLYGAVIIGSWED